MTITAGTKLGRYEIRSKLGAGGMGEVYLAQDTKLERKVALKLLPADLTRDRDRVRRFQQEARAASALNHPNIITIFEIGQVEERHFIATEFIDGETLRQHIAGSRSRVADDRSRTSGTPLKLRDILNIAIQTADALAAAHEAGVVHRDIKPENVMVRRRDGYVKVLDFGLAKLMEGTAVTVDPEAPTRAHVKTSAGLVMGTVNYMSPEQARGERIDARTDIWSLGVVLYEMVAGLGPFDGASATEVIALILEREPPPLARYAREVPTELERIVSRALTKDREERYQTAKDLLIDLRRLRQRLELEAEIERFAMPGSGSEGTVTTDGTRASVVTADEDPARPDKATVRPTSSAEFLVSEIKRHKTGAVVAFGALIIAVATITFGWYKFANRSQSSVQSLGTFQAMKITRLTTTGKVADAAISPDGKYVVHVVDDGGQQSLWMRQVATSSNVQIAAPADVVYRGLTFSRDGNYVYYVKWDKKTSFALYQMPVLGGVARRLVVDVDSAVTFSPDDRRLAFIRGYPSIGESALIVANADGTAEKKLAVRKGPDFFPVWGDKRNAPAWSPDGKSIATPLGTVGTGGPNMSVAEVRVEDGAVKAITAQKWEQIEGVEWLRDGSVLILNARQQSSSPFQIWNLSYPSGEPHRITNDLNDYRGVSLTADAKVLATIQSDVVSNIWIAPNNSAGLARQITSGRSDGPEGISWTPDGKIIYTSRANGNLDLWIIDADGSNQKQLTIDARNNRNPAISPDGRYIVFSSDRTGLDHIWRMNIDGSNLKQLTKGSGEIYPDCSPDSQWIVYMSLPDNAAVWKMPIAGGEPVQLANKYLSQPVISPDEKLIAGFYWDELAVKVAIYPFNGGQPIRSFDIWNWVRWTPDGRALAYIDRRNLSNITSQLIDGSPSRHLTDFKDGRIFNFAWSRDGKQLALARGPVTNDVVLISSFREQQ